MTVDCKLKVQFIDIVSSTEDKSGTWVEKGGHKSHSFKTAFILKLHVNQ